MASFVVSKSNMKYIDPELYDKRFNSQIENYIASLWGPIIDDCLEKNIKVGNVVADLGCGTLVHINKMSKAKLIYAVDISKEMLDFGLHKIKKIKDKVRIICSDCTRTGIPNKICDLVWTDGVSEYLNLEDFIKEISRISKPGAKLIIVFRNLYNPYNLIELFYLKLTRKNKVFRSLKQINECFNEFGFNLINYKSVGTIFYSPRFLERYFIGFYRFFDKWYLPLQKKIPLGSNVMAIFEKCR